MSLSVGIIGLPNVGKSTIFNALTESSKADCANYPFCTIEPNNAIVNVPDERVDKLSELVTPERKAYTTIEFIDIAGLVKGASQGEGLGNQFLAQIREVDALMHVVRCFHAPDVAHIKADLNPVEDIDIINTELVLADLQTIDNRISKLEKNVPNDKSLKPLLEIAEGFRAYLNDGHPLSAHPQLNDELARQLRRNTHFLTDKTMIHCCNIGEEDINKTPDTVKQVQKHAADNEAATVILCGAVENEIAGLPPHEQNELLQMYEMEESGLKRTIRKTYTALSLKTFFTAQKTEVKAWTFTDGCTAPQAAGLIHSDFEKGFIRAKVVAYDDFVYYGSQEAAREAGRLRTEGKNYLVQDGDVIEFLFNT